MKSAFAVLFLGSALLGAGCGQSTTVGASEDCLIKGNISASGERIYHEPGDRFYDATEIDRSNGERWFCTSDEAKEAGWRHSKV